VRARFERLRSEIISCLATVEALIDFGEGEDIEEGVYEQGSILSCQLHATFLHPRL
jgi:tRNA modification GTPase